MKFVFSDKKILSLFTHFTHSLQYDQKIKNIKKMPITNVEFEPKNQKLKKKNADYQPGFWTKNIHFWKLKLDFFLIKVFRLTANMNKKIIIN